MNKENENVEIITTQQDTSIYLITKAEIDQQISTAKAFPRSVAQSLETALSLATISEDVAESCIYALPRGGKVIEGPSVRLAEIIASSWGNLRAGARVIDNDGKKIICQGICHDLEKNYCATIEVSRSIMQNEYKNGKPTGKKYQMNEDMQVVTGNAGNAIAYRNAVFKVIPAALTQSIYEKVKQVAKGSSETLTARRNKAVDWFNNQGVKNEQICKALEIKKIEDIDLDKLATLSGMRSALKNGESTVKEMFDAEEKKSEPTKPTLTNNEVAQAIVDGLTLESLQTTYHLSDEQIEMFNQK